MTQTALITGGSSGIGLEVSRRLAARGWRLLWVSLSEDEIAAAREALLATLPGALIEGLALDLAVPDAPQRVFEWAETQGGCDLLINNAGFGVYGPSSNLALEAEQAMIAVNIAALHALTRLVLPAMTARGGGTIVNIASNSAFVPAPDLAVYAATKAFVKHYSEALTAELEEANSPVRVMTVCPSAISDTPFLKRAGMEGVRTFTSFTATTAEEVASDIIAGLDQNRRFVLTGAAMRRAMWLMKLAPAPVLRWMTRRETRKV
ncbi:SDR family NAD(P)-dependent oxidoreductase [Hyphomonadaceae bacterium BL14]|nr:SDR family NAD(P)-dependent oxidoreductase [Hyphomonadaceae bacterium BL14]